MRKLFLLIVMLFVFSNVFAADTTNCVVNYVEDDMGVLYYGPATFPAAAGTDNSFTQYMAIHFADFQNFIGDLQVWATDITGTEDYNGYIEFSNTTTAASFLSLATDADLDALAITVVADTVGMAEGVKCNGFKYMRLKFDGQTGNPNGLSVNWYIYIPKKIEYRRNRVAHVGSTS